MTARADFSADVPLSAAEFRELRPVILNAPSGERSAGLHGHVGVRKLDGIPPRAERERQSTWTSTTATSEPWRASINAGSSALWSFLIAPVTRLATGFRKERL